MERLPDFTSGKRPFYTPVFMRNKIPGYQFFLYLISFTFLILPYFGYNQTLHLNDLSNTIVLKGTIITPGKSIPGGFLIIRNNRIAGIYSSLKPADYPVNSIYVDTRGIIFPGLVDLHNHVPFNVFPYWEVGKNKFANRYEWRFNSPYHQKHVKTPYDQMDDLFCSMNAYGELRALIGGTTTIGNSGYSSCLKRLVRNLDDPSQLEGNRIQYQVDIVNHDTGNPSKTSKINEDLDSARARLVSGRLDAFFIHLAEGRVNDAITKSEFGILLSRGLVTDKTAIIHGISLSQDEFHIMKYLGASLIWSPGSNINLYGQTTDVIKARNVGVKLALSADWAITGNRNLLEELKYAASWNSNHLNNFFSDRELVEMATSIPAEIAGLSDKLGSIREGLFADLLIISGDSTKPYRSLIQSTANSVKIVIVDGLPVYGTQYFMEKFWPDSQLETLLHGPSPMMLKLPLPGESALSVYLLKQLLSQEMIDLGTSLAPLFPLARGSLNPGTTPVTDYRKPGLINKKMGPKKGNEKR
jgi:5-methylthioadenosine/S-adenosylhomocysteine deaminase